MIIMDEKRTEKNKEIIEEIEEAEKRRKSKKIFKILLWIFVPLFIIFIVSYTLLRYVGNIGIMVREYAVYDEELPESFSGIKVVHFSDIHYNQYSSISNIEKLVKMINNTNPDIVVFTGDLIDSNYEIDTDTKELIMKYFNDINASIGKYAIKGEEDFENFKEIFDNSNFKILENSIEKIYYKNDTISLIAVDSNYQKENVTGNIEAYSIALIHEPDLADRIIDDYDPDLILAGHSHNGQIILPLIGAVIKKDGAKKYISSYYKLDSTELYVSGGIGNSKVQFRLFNHPSFNFYRLRLPHN